ncbi:FlgT C-terminal domain-containing protein [Reinekea blandensis]|uniref:Flagellar assembly protein T C-terminal domain-containing protein n=1 Tax=Reinekea blandensis MED297 TaxID=314283 RepID=A4B9D2_9GAMM|nr:FlgT C-terminal domain-containing protein [Reinekea blandensis]EAR11233.1 hypothetical protein MED297_20137 [Reinekea sp. MED297] [Reinekea blandensis MED297]
MWPKLLLCLTLMYASAAVGAGNVLLVTDLDDDNLNYRPDLRLLATSAINRLQDYEVANAKTSARPNSSEAIGAMIEAADRAGLEAVAVITLYTDRRDATLTASLYSVSTGELTIQRALEFRFRDMPPLLAQLEYELPLMLKREFRELGSVVKVDSDLVYFDLGRNAGVEPGQIYRVFRRGEEIKTRSGDSFGFVDEQTGVIEVVEVSAIYAIAEIHLGRMSIQFDDWVELTGQDFAVRGQVLSKLDNQIAVNIGRRAGVSPGAYFAIYKDIKAIDDDDAFRETIGRIRITEVSADTARGEIARSDHYRLAKALIQEGDYIDEVSYRHRNQLLFGQSSFGILGDTSSTWNAGLNLESGVRTDLAFRVRGAYGDTWFASLGANSALNHSESFRAGLDILYSEDGLGTYLFTDANIPTPLNRYMLFAIEAGYLLGGNDNAEGLSVGVTLKLGIDSLF